MSPMNLDSQQILSLNLQNHSFHTPFAQVQVPTQRLGHEDIRTEPEWEWISGNSRFRTWVCIRWAATYGETVCIPEPLSAECCGGSEKCSSVTELLPNKTGPHRGIVMEKLMPAMRMLLLLLLCFIFLVVATLSQLTTMPRPFLKGSMPAEGVIDRNGVLVVIHMKRAHGRSTPTGYPPAPKVNPPYHG